MKVVIDPHIVEYVRDFNIQIRQGPTPSSVGIEGLDDVIGKIPAICLNGTGIIWVAEEVDGSNWNQLDMQFIALHEVGHAMMGLYPELKISTRDHEISAHAIALSLCIQFDINVRPKMLSRLSKFYRKKTGIRKL